MVTRTNRIIGLASLALAGASASPALARPTHPPSLRHPQLAAYTLRLSVPKTHVDNHKLIAHIVAHGRASSKVTLEIFGARRSWTPGSCAHDADGEATHAPLIGGHVAFAHVVTKVQVTDRFSETATYDTQRHAFHACAYLYKTSSPTHTLAHAHTSWPAHA
jgi:hypothetical protein